MVQRIEAVRLEKATTGGVGGSGSPVVHRRGIWGARAGSSTTEPRAAIYEIGAIPLQRAARDRAYQGHVDVRPTAAAGVGCEGRDRKDGRVYEVRVLQIQQALSSRTRYVGFGIETRAGRAANKQHANDYRFGRTL